MAGRHRIRGFTLVELVAVVIVLGTIAVVVLPALAPASSSRLELAASEAASAYRFARAEALRSGLPHGVHTEPSLDRLRVFRVDTATTPATPVYDVRHPVSKRLYELDLPLHPMLRGVDLAAAASWRSACSAPGLLVFDARGTPRCGDPLPVLLEDATVSLSLDGETRSVAIDGLTGRVSAP